jgi:hypothetical protein
MLLPALLGLAFQEESRWRWLLFGIAVGMCVAALIFHFLLHDGGKY